jgi:phosphoribosyl-ATP pyrophosphohydrolase/phosphoribosyl-AMP cyclohydrolase
MKKCIYADINAVAIKEASLKELVNTYIENGIDGFYIYDFASVGDEKEKFIYMVRDVMENVRLPFFIGINVDHFEDIKKALYTGAKTVFVRYRENKVAINAGFMRFGAEKIGLELNYAKDECSEESLNLIAETGFKKLMIKHIELIDKVKIRLNNSDRFDIIIRDSLVRNDLTDLLSMSSVRGVATNFYDGKNLSEVKSSLKEMGFETNAVSSAVPFSNLKTNDAGLIPVIVQDAKNDEVLMLAYMNEESYNKTVETGLMHYYSRSRKSLWLKGETSGHFQHVKELFIDCDNDTILAKVDQVGAACHTGNRSCFYRGISGNEDAGVNTESLSILKEVYDTIADRKLNPKEGSYTNYLFEKGIDKILKKCGEESTEIVIAAKNPNQIELKYEIADYLYHLMVLMVETGLSWEEIMEELSNRH